MVMPVLPHMPWCAIYPPEREGETWNISTFAAVLALLCGSDRRSKTDMARVLIYMQGWIKGAIRAAQFELRAVQQQLVEASPSL